MQTSKPRSVLLAFLILTNFQQIPALAQIQGGLRITIVEGEGAINNVKQRVNRDPIVQVEDDNRRPVAGAIVTFFLPDSGPSGTFVNGTRQLTLTTNAEGRATAMGIRPNSQTGPMQIRVTANFQGQTASAVISQTNAVGSGGSGASAGGGMSASTKVLIFLGVAGAAAVGAVVAVHSGNSSSSSGPAVVPPIVLTPGTPTVGGPR